MPFKMKEQQRHIKGLIAETLTLLCKSGLSFKENCKIEALIGITLDDDDVFLVNIKQRLGDKGNAVSNYTSSELEDNEVADSGGESGGPSKKHKKNRKRKRKRSSSQRTTDGPDSARKQRKADHGETDSMDEFDGDDYGTMENNDSETIGSVLHSSGEPNIACVKTEPEETHEGIVIVKQEQPSPTHERSTDDTYGQLDSVVANQTNDVTASDNDGQLMTDGITGEATHTATKKTSKATKIQPQPRKDLLDVERTKDILPKSDPYLIDNESAPRTCSPINAKEILCSTSPPPKSRGAPSASNRESDIGSLKSIFQDDLIPPGSSLKVQFQSGTSQESQRVSQKASGASQVLVTDTGPAADNAEADLVELWFDMFYSRKAMARALKMIMLEKLPLQKASIEAGVPIEALEYKVFHFSSNELRELVADNDDLSQRIIRSHYPFALPDSFRINIESDKRTAPVNARMSDKGCVKIPQQFTNSNQKPMFLNVNGKLCRIMTKDQFKDHTKANKPGPIEVYQGPHKKLEQPPRITSIGKCIIEPVTIAPLREGEKRGPLSIDRPPTGALSIYRPPIGEIKSDSAVVSSPIIPSEHFSTKPVTIVPLSSTAEKSHKKISPQSTVALQKKGNLNEEAGQKDTNIKEIVKDHGYTVTHSSKTVRPILPKSKSESLSSVSQQSDKCVIDLERKKPERMRKRKRKNVSLKSSMVYDIDRSNSEDESRELIEPDETSMPSSIPKPVGLHVNRASISKITSANAKLPCIAGEKPAPNDELKTSPLMTRINPLDMDHKTRCNAQHTDQKFAMSASTRALANDGKTKAETISIKSILTSTSDNNRESAKNNKSISQSSDASVQSNVNTTSDQLNADFQRKSSCETTENKQTQNVNASSSNQNRVWVNKICTKSGIIHIGPKFVGDKIVKVSVVPKSKSNSSKSQTPASLEADGEKSDKHTELPPIPVVTASDIEEYAD